MPLNENDFSNLKRKVEQFKQTLNNTLRNRERWQTDLKATLLATLRQASEAAGLNCTIEEHMDIVNLESVVLSLGASNSGLGESVGNDMRRDLVKQNGALVYQQLFNGKILVVVNYPFIEKYGQPQPPKQIAIYRPEELNPPHFVRHLEEFMTEVTAWEDFDDDQFVPHQVIGFKHLQEEESAPEK